MKELKVFARQAVSEIDDILERRSAEKEVYAALMDAYDEEMAMHHDSEKAIAHVIEDFGYEPLTKEELKNAHIRKIGKKEILILAIFVISVFVLLHILLIWAFGGF